MEHSGSRSRLISSRIWRTQEGEWKFQQESTDEQKYSTDPAVIPPLKLIYEGVQAEFDGWFEQQSFLIQELELNHQRSNSNLFLHLLSFMVGELCMRELSQNSVASSTCIFEIKVK